MEVYIIKGMSNSYLTSDGVLIDAGAKADNVIKTTKEHGIGIKYLFITHYHIDHIRYAWSIAKAFNCRVVASIPESAIIEGREKPRNAGLLQSLFSSMVRVKSVNVDIKVNDGEAIEGYRAVYAPGHTPGSTAYLKGDLLFSGDAVVERGGKPALPPRMFTLDVGKATESFNKLLSLRPRTIYPGHGSPISLGT
ncbi:MBL fold hydrolase [Vulcanisaeta souniana JCM 11219]|uniref:MBL fold hydrolase n=2 Tax=Vulcanisaeta souniana TaxID=164452 RepID=A0A830E8Z8_9CREN|nr:MBL fold metallo-hydrolase [Vulcanisaeta souniana]BDR92472.1 MBL fold hydrolase [Vulcanisaeta souniana JCM 11219]GGI75774.1 MBL fold hydrolase [Vulcanisaeta souniana JCM 11219]